jgi:hypothetical protein
MRDTGCGIRDARFGIAQKHISVSKTSCMKNIMTIMLCIFLFSTVSVGQEFVAKIKNSTGKDLAYGVDIDHGTGPLPGVIKKGTTTRLTFSPNVLTGVEGNIFVLPAGEDYNRVIIYYDNPFIGTATYDVTSSNYNLQGKPLKWSLTSKGQTAELEVEITDNTYSKGPVAIALNSNGAITGSILWNKNDITAPDIFPYGDAFTCSVLAPTQFVESNGPFTLEKAGMYNGTAGYFQGVKKVGAVTYETLQSFNPNYVEIRYTITGVPTGVPLDMDIVTRYDKTKWTAGPLKPRPADDYVFVVGTFSSPNKSSIMIDNNLYQLKGLDFSCEGDWLKVDGNGGIVGGGGDMVNKIESRKSSVVLPGNGTFVMTKTATSSNQMIASPVQNKTQNTQVQKVRTVGAGAVKIKQ